MIPSSMKIIKDSLDLYQEIRPLYTCPLIYTIPYTLLYKNVSVPNSKNIVLAFYFMFPMSDMFLNYSYFN